MGRVGPRQNVDALSHQYKAVGLLGGASDWSQDLAVKAERAAVSVLGKARARPCLLLIRSAAER